MALRITLGHCSCHTRWSYFRPATRYVTSLPATASAVALASSRSAAKSSSVAFTCFGERLTWRMRSEYCGRWRETSRPMTPLAPRMVCIRALRNVILRHEFDGDGHVAAPRHVHLVHGRADTARDHVILGVAERRQRDVLHPLRRRDDRPAARADAKVHARRAAADLGQLAVRSLFPVAHLAQAEPRQLMFQCIRRRSGVLDLDGLRLLLRPGG